MIAIWIARSDQSFTAEWWCNTSAIVAGCCKFVGMVPQVSTLDPSRPPPVPHPTLFHRYFEDWPGCCQLPVAFRCWCFDMLCGHVALHLAFGVCGLEFPPGAGSLERRSSACMGGCMAGRGFLETKRGWTKSLGGQSIYIYISDYISIIQYHCSFGDPGD